MVVQIHNVNKPKLTSHNSIIKEILVLKLAKIINTLSFLVGIAITINIIIIIMKTWLDETKIQKIC